MATNEEMIAELARLRAENEALKSTAVSRLGIKVSEKGAVSVYGFGRFPVTLYRSQWVKLFAAKADIEAFLTSHASELKDKESVQAKEVLPAKAPMTLIPKGQGNGART